MSMEWPGSLGICIFCEMMNYYKWEVCSEKNMYTNSHYFLICFLISSGFRMTVSVSPANEHEKAVWQPLMSKLLLMSKIHIRGYYT